jgi:hypothetical protein
MAYYNLTNYSELVFVRSDTPIVLEDFEAALASDLAKQSAEDRAIYDAVARMPAYSVNLLFPPKA